MKGSIIILILWNFIASVSLAQTEVTTSDYSPEARGDHGIRVVFYNVENLFDTFDDPAINDDEFTPDGEKRWSYYRYKEKLNNIAKTIIAVGGWEPPAVVGLCEVENFQVLLDLITKTPLEKFGYQIIHENSTDRRGIDNALLYRPEKLDKVSHQFIRVTADSNLFTRDILHAQFAFLTDTIHFFVNHWPSRFGGKEFSEGKRILVAHTLRSNIDSLVTINSNVKILIMGDFNDEPGDNSLAKILKALPSPNEFRHDQLYNLSYADYRSGKGTLVYKEIDYTWFLFDQMIASGALLEGNGLLTLGLKNHIFMTSWLLKNDKPSRTYQGPIYRGGFSDHLPIFIDLYYKD